MKFGGSEKLIGSTVLMHSVLFFSIVLNLPLVRQITCFIYLLFYPGLMVLKILRLSTQDIITDMLFSVGLSITFLMFLGLVVNSLYPSFGITSPLAPLPIMITTSVAAIALSGLAFSQNHSFFPRILQSGHRFSTLSDTLTEAALFGLPALSVFGALLVISSGNNSILLVLLAAISVLTGFIAFSKKVFGLEILTCLILAIALALMLHVSLSSQYLVGYDVHAELNLFNTVIVHSEWDISITYNYNAMLSITILPLILSYFLNVDPILVFKIVMVLIFSLVPVALFRVYQNQMGSKIGFLSTFLFMSGASFYLGMQGLVRQMIGEVFLALLLLLIVDKRMNVKKRRLLSFIFGAALIVSHYTLALIFLIFIIPVLALPYLTIDKTRNEMTIDWTYVLSFAVVLFCWYYFSSGGAVLTSFVQMTERASFTNVGGGLMYVSSAYGIFLHKISQYVANILQFLIIIGVVDDRSRARARIDKEYLMMSLASLAVLLLCIAFPYFGETLKISRIFELMLIFLSPYCLLGGITVFKLVGQTVSAVTHIFENENLMIFAICILIISFFLFQSGFVYEVMRDPAPTSLPLSGYRANPSQNWEVFAPYTSRQEIISARFLSTHMGSQTATYSDVSSMFDVLTSCGVIPSQRLQTRWNYVITNTSFVLPGSYIWLRQPNFGKIEGPQAGEFWNIQDISGLLNSSSIVYSNGESMIYKVSGTP